MVVRSFETPTLKTMMDNQGLTNPSDSSTRSTFHVPFLSRWETKKPCMRCCPMSGIEFYQGGNSIGRALNVSRLCLLRRRDRPRESF
ncbi:hypothetical protein JI435_414460 [Parastagonospora nodorum SN15]|uniref:Uncharacterized protein n=1 Tax=Phaeosphaeria nodorum (strain SN15 / ATCC MYA-4574 / FGSC 10173) TaxID=321614 RepID=A0A7U2F790_PHANO|nr:hypothetical protein JI435_414460 [Parastagonospora nodorum SN15]